LAPLTWTPVDSYGSLFSRGKNDYYAILVRGIPEERPKDCIIELYVTDKELTTSEIKYNAEHEQIELLSRQIVLGKLLPVTSIEKAVEEMKDTAERRENENRGTSLSSAYASKYYK
jgi:hypothetical protein